jgi:sugar phosphate isomerase/epimerase
MATSIGMIIPPKIRAQGMQRVTAWAREVGLDALDLPADFTAAAQACREAGLRIGTVEARGLSRLLSEDGATRAQAISEISEQVRAMPALGARVLFVCFVPEQRAQPIARSLALFAESFPPIAAECEAAGVRVAIEGWPGPAPHYPTLGYTPEVWRAMFAAVPSPALGLCYDPSHLVRLGIDYLRVLQEFAGRINHCHGKDTELLPEARYLYGPLPPALGTTPSFSGGAWRYTVPGDGAVDWAAIAHQLEQADYQGCVSIELEDARYWGTQDKEEQGIRKALQTLSHHFREPAP